MTNFLSPGVSVVEMDIYFVARGPYIRQIDALKYSFTEYGSTHIYDWLSSDCVWNYRIHTDPDYIVSLAFDDIGASIEFKLRFL